MLTDERRQEIAATADTADAQQYIEDVNAGELTADIRALLAEIDRLRAREAEQAERLAMAVRFYVGGDVGGRIYVVVRQSDRDAPWQWAVERYGECLTKSGKWEASPLPSQSDAYAKRTRWDSFDEALSAARKVIPAEKGNEDVNANAG